MGGSEQAALTVYTPRAIPGFGAFVVCPGFVPGDRGFLGSGTCRSSAGCFLSENLWNSITKRVILGQGLALDSGFLMVLIGGQDYTQSGCVSAYASFTSAPGDSICWRKHSVIPVWKMSA